MTSTIMPVGVKKKLFQKAKYSHNKRQKYDGGELPKWHLQSEKKSI